MLLHSNMNNDAKWYQKSLWVIALLIFFFPAGVYIMWRYSRWSKFSKWLVTIFLILVALRFVFSDYPSANTQVIVPTPTSQATQISQYIFDIPTLVGKDLKGVSAILGAPKGIDPTAQQIKLGATEWDKTFEKDGHKLLVTYTISNKKIVDFFIETDDSSGITQDTAHLLQLGNLQLSDPKYRVEFVKTIRDPSRFTGVKVLPN